MKSSNSSSSSSGAPTSPPPPEDISSESESEADSLERAQLNASIQQNRRLSRRSYRKFARLLSKCTPEKLGAELAAEVKAMFGEANQQHLLSSNGGSSGDEEADIALLSQASKSPDPDGRDDTDDQDGPSSSSNPVVNNSVPVC